MSTDERLELVQSFDELRVGLIVVVKPCFCGGAHRGLLLSLGHGWSDSDPRPRPFFALEPRPPCIPMQHTGMGIDDGSVSRHQVFRVVDWEAEQRRPEEEREREAAF